MVLLSFTPNHIRLINACYPAVPQAAGPQYQPNSQELSRLTYYASNKPRKLQKLADELEKRVKVQARRAQSGYLKHRALLLVSLDILRALTTECRRDLALFSGAVLTSVETALLCLPKDLEVIARAASTFTAWATYTDASLLGVDDVLTRTYLDVLKLFANMGATEPRTTDDEDRSRKRLIGLACVSSVIQSDPIFNAMSLFSQQVQVITASLLSIITRAELAVLTTEATAVETYAMSATPNPFMAEFQPQRPSGGKRRAPSIHVHVDGEKGPSFSDVVGAALRALQNLIGRSSAIQVPVVLVAIFATFDDKAQAFGWDNIEFCKWLTSKITDWTQYQYRFAVPTRLLERLVRAKDASEPTPLHFTLLAMMTTVFTSPTPLINLSTSDILTSILNFMISRLIINPSDPLLQPIVDCVASLGVHIYYADQLRDLVEQIVTRLVSLQVNGLRGRGRDAGEKGREEGMRCLVACLDGLLRVADEAHPPRPKVPVGRVSENSAGRAASPALQHRSKSSADSSQVAMLAAGTSGPATPGAVPLTVRGRRNKVAPEVWQDTLALLCENEYQVRSAYAAALVRFLREEIDKEPFATEDSEDLEARARRLAAESPSQNMTSDPTTRFLHALHASAFTLALAANLGLVSSPPPASSSSSLSPEQTKSPINIIPPTPLGTPGVAEQAPILNVSTPNGSTDELSHSEHGPGNPARRSVGSGLGGAQRVRKASLGIALLDLSAANGTTSGTAPATLSDYTHLLSVLTAVHETLPARSLLTGLPMLFALDASARADTAKEDKTSLRRKAVIREVVARLWGVIGCIWGCAEILHHTQRQTKQPSFLPPLPCDWRCSAVQKAEDPVEFGAVDIDTMISSGALSKSHFLDPDTAKAALSQNSHVQRATGLDAVALFSKLSTPWSAEQAVKDSIECAPDHDQYARPDGAAHLLKISPGLMSNDNKSLASIARTARGVGVDDLREALEGRGSMSNVHLPSGAYSLSSDGGHQPSVNGTTRDHSLARLAVASAHHKNKRAPLNRPGDVADVLNKLGIGKQKSDSLLHTPFAGAPKTQDSPMIAPPYRA